jgi:hypothetical protein
MKNFLSLIFKAAVVLTIIVVSWKILEYVSFKILLKKGLVTYTGTVNSYMYNRKINFWAVSENAQHHYVDGYDTNLKQTCQIYMDDNGFVTGDTANLPKQKPANTIRIFLTGGSAMYGSLATVNVTNNNTYPVGSYCYQADIAGQLKQILEQAHPELNFEVVNAAIVQHQFNQNYAMYYQRFHDYHPDIIINMDGYNDCWPVRGISKKGDPYYGVEEQIAEQLNLDMLQRASRYGCTAMLMASTFLQHKPAATKQDDNAIAFTNKWSANDVKTIITELKNKDTDSTYNKAKYAMLDSCMNDNWNKELWLIKSYEQQLASDSVYSIFCLQPMLERYYQQKPLSKLEQQLLTACLNFSDTHITLDSLLISINNKPADALNAYYQLGNGLPFLRQYYMQYYINQTQSPTLNEVVQQFGGDYIDMNAEMKNIPADKEFYVDYCHMTPYGNQFVAEQFAERVEKYLTTKKLSTPSSTK